MIVWSEQSDDQLNELIARTFFGWEPVLCNDEMGNVSDNDFSEYNTETCSVCWESAEYGEKLVHGIIPHGMYLRSMHDAWKVVEVITKPPTKPLGIHAPNVIFSQWWQHADLWAMSEAEASTAIYIAAFRAYGVEIEP